MGAQKTTATNKTPQDRKSCGMFRPTPGPAGARSPLVYSQTMVTPGGDTGCIVDAAQCIVNEQPRIVELGAARSVSMQEIPMKPLLVLLLLLGGAAALVQAQSPPQAPASDSPA